MSIGKFEKLGDDYRGSITLLGTETRVLIVPVTEKTTAKSPDFHLTAKEKIGAAWRKFSTTKGTEYLSVVLNDLPTVNFMLFQGEGDTYDLVAPRKPRKQQ